MFKSPRISPRELLKYLVREKVSDYKEAVRDVLMENPNTNPISFIPYKRPKTHGQHLENMVALERLERVFKAMRLVLSQKAPTNTDNVVWNTLQLRTDKVSIRSRMRIEHDERPKARLVADYSFGPLQGSYMGGKPVKGKTRNKTFPVVYVK